MTTSASLAITTDHHQDEIVVRLQGELDISNVDGLRQVIRGILECPPHTLVMDVAGLGFADCGSLSVLVSAHRRLAEQGHKLIVTDSQPLVRRLLTVTGLDALLHLSDSGTCRSHPDPNAPVPS